MGFLEKLNEVGIPKIFWYTVSLCLMISTGSFIWLMFRSQSVNIEISDTKIQLIHSLTKAEIALEDVKQKQLDLEKPVTTGPVTTRPVILPPVKVDEIDKSIKNLQDIRQQIQVK